MQKCQMEDAVNANGVGSNVGPIPDNKPNINCLYADPVQQAF